MIPSAVPQPRCPFWSGPTGGMLTGHQLSSQRHPQGVRKRSRHGTPSDSPQESPLQGKPFPKVRTSPEDGDPTDLGGALRCPGAGQGPWKAAVRTAPGQSGALAEGRTVTLSHAPPRTACPDTPPVGTEGFIVRDVQFSNVHWDFSGFSTATTAFHAAVKDIWPSHQERPLWLTPSSPHTRTEHTALDTETAAHFGHRKSSLEGEESLRW